MSNQEVDVSLIIAKFWHFHFRSDTSDIKSSEFLWTDIGKRLDPRYLTCYDCPDREECEFADDLYNTYGDCLAEK